MTITVKTLRCLEFGSAAAIRKRLIKRARDSRAEETVVAGIDPKHWSRCRRAEAARSLRQPVRMAVFIRLLVHVAPTSASHHDECGH